jgi:DNA-binding transcriptional MocR family regulator
LICLGAANNRQLVTNWTASALLAEIACGWIEDGTAMELVRRQRQEARRRQEIAARLLHGLPYLTQRESLQVWLELPPAVSEGQFVAQARLHGVAVAPGASFHTGSRPIAGAGRIAVGSTSTDDLTRGLQTLVELYRHEPEPMLAAI